MRPRGIGIKSWAGLTVGALLIAACAAAEDTTVEQQDGEEAVTEATDEDAGADEETEADEGAAATPQPGGELRMVIGPEPATLNPMQTVRADHMVSIAMIEPLIKIEPESQDLTEDGLVTGWERIDDQTWRFTLREGVEFHNGEVFDADAAVFTIEEHRDEVQSTTGPFFQVFESVEAISPTEFDLVTTTPNNSVPYLLTNVFALPPEHYTELGAEGFGRDPVGTGPFVFEEWRPGESIRAVANGDYWQEPPFLDAITWSWSADPSTRVSLLQTDQADLVVDVPIGSQGEVEEGAATELVRYDRLVKIMLFLPLEGATADPEVRQAIAKAIDREGLVEGVYEGVGAQADATFMNSFFESAGGHEESLDYDPDAASEIIASLDEAPSITISWPTGRYLSPEPIAGMLEGVGIEVERNPLDFGTFFSQVVGGALEGAFVFGTLPTFPHEDVQAQAFLTSTSITRTCPDERLDDLAVEAVSEVDRAGSADIYNEMERIALYDLVCFVPLYEQVSAYGHLNEVEGFVPARDDLHDYRRVWLNR